MKNHSKLLIVTLSAGLMSLTGCLSDGTGAKVAKKLGSSPSQQNSSPSNIGGEPPPGGNNTGNPADNVGVPGVPGASVPTGEAIAMRIQNGLRNNAVRTARNFNTVYNSIGANLPRETNPNRATGFDQVPLLAYAACSDVPLNAYGIAGNNLATNRNALIAAGRNIIDQHTGGLASTGPMADGVTQILTDLVDKNAAIQGETVQQSFISVCMAASVFGAQMMGF